MNPQQLPHTHPHTHMGNYCDHKYNYIGHGNIELSCPTSFMCCPLLMHRYCIFLLHQSSPKCETYFVLLFSVLFGFFFFA